eukprot:532523_1
MGSCTSADKDKKTQFIDGMYPYRIQGTYENVKGSHLDITTSMDLIKTKIECKNIEENIQHYIEQFCRRDECRNISQIDQFKYNPNVETRFKPEIYLNINLSPDDKKEYSDTLESICKILTGYRNIEKRQEMVQLIINEFLRKCNINLPDAIIKMCDKYHGPFEFEILGCIRPLDLEWGEKEDEIELTVTKLQKLFHNVIEGDTIKNQGWKCILSRRLKSKYSTYLNDLQDTWFIWWFIRDNEKTVNRSECILLQIYFRYIATKVCSYV